VTDTRHAMESAPPQPQRTRRLLFWLAGVFTGLVLLLLALAVLLWVLLRGFAADLNPVINPLLERFVGPGSRIDIGYFNRDTFFIDELVLQPDADTDIRARQLALTYDLSRLLGGDIDSLSAEHLSLRLSAGSEAAGGTSTAASTATDTAATTAISLPQLTGLMTLPIRTISLPRIQIDTPDVQATLSADLNTTLWWLRGDADIPEVDGTVQLDARLQRTPATASEPERADLLLMMSQQQTLLAQLWAGLIQTADDTRADIRLQTDLPLLQQRLPMLRDLPVSGAGLTLSGQLSSPNDAHWPQQLTGQISARLKTSRSQVADGVSLQPLTTGLQVQHDTDDSDWQIALMPGEVTLTLQQPDMPTETLKITPQALSAHCRPGFSACELTSVLQGVMTAADYRAGFALQPEVLWQTSDMSRATLPLSATLDIAATETLPALHITAAGQLTAGLTPEGLWTLSANDGLTLQANGVTLTTGDAGARKDWAVSPLAATALRGLTLSGDLNNPAGFSSSAWEVALAPVRISSGKELIRLGKTSVACTPAALTSTLFVDDLLENCALDTRLLPSDWDIWPVPDVQLSGPFSLSYTDSHQALSSALNLTAASQQVKLRARLQHDLLSGNGSLQWHLQDAALDWNVLGMPQMANLTMTQLLNGQLSGQGWVDWQATEAGFDITPDVMLRADKVGLIYNNLMTLDEGNVLLALRRPQGKDYLLDAQVSAGKLDNGITLSNILARSQTRIPADFSYVDAEIYEMHTDVLGGRVYTPLIRYDSRKEVNAFGIRLDHIQLSQLAELEAQAGVQADGLLDGMLPVVLTKEGPSIPGGTLFARDPGGVIRYKGDTADALSKSNQGTGLAMQLLSDFRYQILESGVQYRPDGQLNLALKFEGHNPDFFDGQKTLLNVNLEYNLLDLLESLRLSNDVIQKIEDKYR